VHTITNRARLAGKRALATGGGRAIGAAIVRRPVADGAAVAIDYGSEKGVGRGSGWRGGVGVEGNEVGGRYRSGPRVRSPRTYVAICR
jgi:NAD(P)-dependent dehydrogenase (short-subunit alcohol dehydrogenase family)